MLGRDFLCNQSFLCKAGVGCIYTLWGFCFLGIFRAAVNHHKGAGVGGGLCVHHQDHTALALAPTGRPRDYWANPA